MSESNPVNVWDIQLPEPTEPLIPSHLRNPPIWAEFVCEMQPALEQYLKTHDSAEERLATKPRQRFVLD